MSRTLGEVTGGPPGAPKIAGAGGRVALYAQPSSATVDARATLESSTISIS